MRLVAENSEEDLARERAKLYLSQALRELTANLLRVTRGAGKSYDIGRQAHALIETYLAYRDAVGTWPPSYELDEILSLDDDRPIRSDESEMNHYYGQKRAVRGALQMAASDLLGQRTQLAAGRTELYDGVMLIEEARASVRREHDAYRKALRMAQKVKTPAKRVPKKPAPKP